MRYNKEERLKIGHKIYESGMSYVEAGVIYGISDETARRYQLFYEESNGLSHHTKKSLPNNISTESISKNAEPISSITNYEDMTKEELLQELMKAKIREARLKKGYIVKGVGQTKEYILLSNRNTK